MYKTVVLVLPSQNLLRGRGLGALPGYKLQVPFTGCLPAKRKGDSLLSGMNQRNMPKKENQSTKFPLHFCTVMENPGMTDKWPQKAAAYPKKASRLRMRQSYRDVAEKT